MYRYIADDFDSLMRITRNLLHHNIGFKCWRDSVDDVWIIELTGAF
jgi:hypothetical protein